MPCQVTNASGKLHPLDVVTSFLLLGGFVFLFPPTRFSSFPTLSETQVCFHRGQVPTQDKCPMSLPLPMTHTKKSFVVSSVSDCNEPNPQPESAAVGSVTAISPLSKRVRLLCLILDVSVDLHMSFALAANVGPKT